ncbi:MAG: hypothetical protein ACI8RZ_002097 [Myxococcota bacterium]|jgi:hypothetical protein
MNRIQFLLVTSGTMVTAYACTDKAVEEDIGTFTTDTGGLTGEIPLAIPDNAASALIYCGPFGYNLLGTAWEINKPDGSLYYTHELHEAHTAEAMRVGVHDDMVPILLPVSPDHDISGGAWSVNVWVAAGKAPVDVSCSAVYRTGSVPQSGSVDINAVFVGSGLSASDAEGSESFDTMLEELDSIWSGGGLSVGSVSYSDFDGNASKYAVLDSSGSELGELFSTGEDGPALNIFFVEEITASDGATIVGLSAGPPGTTTIGGTSKSGMAITSLDLDGSPAYVAQILAHEGAHFLGLFHTSEKDGSAHDPLSDTAQCTSDGNSDGVIAPSECEGSGADNLMFWAPPETATALSDDQSWVLRRNPVVQ